MATKLGVHAQENQDLIDTAFLSLLVVPNTLLFHEKDGLKGACLVWGASEFGVTAWPVKAKMVGGQKSFQLDTSEEADVKTVHITENLRWFAQDLAILPPAACKDLKPDGRPCGIRLSALGETIKGLVRNSVRHGIPLMAVPWMKKLIIHLEFPVERMPTLELECLKVFTQFVMSHSDDKQLAEMMSDRSIKHRPVVFGSVLGADVSGLVDDVLCPDAKQEMVEAARRCSKALDDMHASALAKRPPAKTAGAKAKKKKKLGEKDLLFVEMSRKDLPVQGEWGLQLVERSRLAFANQANIRL